MSTFDDPNREAVGLEPIWGGAGTPEEPPIEEPPPVEEEPELDEPPDEEYASS